MANKKIAKRITICFVSVIAFLLAVFLLFLCLALKCVYDDSYKDAGGTFMERIQLAAGELFDEETPDRLLARMKYKYLGKAENDTIFLGGSDFLFSREGKEGFSLESDFHGKEKLTEAQLEELCDLLSARKRAYAGDNIGYSLFVIPSSQIVYDDLTGYGEYEAYSSRAEDACRYVSEHTTVSVTYLRDALKDAAEKGAYPVYDNTDDTVNAYGAYVIYRAIYDSVHARGSVLSEDGLSFDLWKTTGRTYARKLSIEKTLQNNSVMLRSDLGERYETMKDTPAYERTRLSDEYGDPEGVSDILFDIGSEREYSLLYPYFAATYTICMFKPDYYYSRLAVNSAMLTNVVQIIREDDLLRLFDENENESFRVGDESDNSEITATPELLGNVHLDPEHVLIAGEAENDAVIRYTLGDNTEEEIAAYGRFFITVKVKRGQSFKLKLTAQSDNKEESPPLYTSVSYDPGASRKDVLSGHNGTLHYTYTMPDYYRENSFTEEELGIIRERLDTRLQDIRALTGKDTKQIILIAPSPLTVYPENASDEMKEALMSNAKSSRLEQLTALYAEDQNTIFLDVTSVFQEHVGEKLYYQTDTHWTDLGAYYAYRTLMRYIAEDGFSASPMPLDSLQTVRTVSPGGDLISFLSLPRDNITERVTYLLPAATRSDFFYTHPETISRSGLGLATTFYIHAAGERLPTAMVLRDSFSAAVMPYMAEHFSTAYFEKMWTTDLDEEVLSTLSPDYVIYIFAERNLEQSLR